MKYSLRRYSNRTLARDQHSAQSCPNWLKLPYLPTEMLNQSLMQARRSVYKVYNTPMAEEKTSEEQRMKDQREKETSRGAEQKSVSKEQNAWRCWWLRSCTVRP